MYPHERINGALDEATENPPVWHDEAPPPNSLEEYGAAPPAPAEPGRDAPEPLNLIDPSAFTGDPPPRRWIVDQWAPVGTAVGLYGEGGAGKSLLAQQLMTCCAAGVPFFGAWTEQVPSLGVFCEDEPDELWRRQQRIEEGLQIGPRDRDRMRWLSRVGQDNVLMAFDAGRGIVSPLVGQIEDAARNFGARLLVIDGAADVFAGNENDRGQVKHFVNVVLTRLALAIDGCVLLLAHPSRAGLSSGSGDSGSTGWNAAFRARWYLEREKATAEDPAPDLDARTLRRMKANYARAGDAIRLRWREGCFTLDSDADGGDWLDRQARMAKCDRLFLALMQRVRDEGRHASHKPNAPTYAPTLFAKRPDRAGFAKADFAGAMERLFVQGKIRVAQVRTAHRNVIDCIEEVGNGPRD